MMAQQRQFPSIQSFFPTTKNIPAPNHAVKPGDGFTAEEVDAVLHPVVDDNWLPDQEYEELEIADLVVGTNRVMFRGRIANLYFQMTTSKKPKAANGFVKMVINDGSGVVTVRLWYSNLEYQLRLGQLVTVWTPHVSNGQHGSLASCQAPLFTSIFPERDRSCHFMIHENSDTGDQFKTPLGYKKGRPLPGLLTLKNFIDGGYDIAENRILVCIKSIGAKKRIPSKREGSSPTECLPLRIFDSTHASATLTLWGPLTLSAQSWIPSHTILLLTNPGWRLDRGTSFSLTSNTLIDIDPSIPDASWLRNFASRLTRAEDPNPEFPTPSMIDVPAALRAQKQILFTFATLDAFARAAPTEKFTGWLSGIITQINLTLLHRRRMLLSSSHCGVPVYANTPEAQCKQCNTSIPLRLNPQILGPVIDETGGSKSGKLFLSEEAWGQLLGMGKRGVCEAGMDGLRWLEQRIEFVRVSLGVAWFAEEGDAGVGRVWVWAVRT